MTTLKTYFLHEDEAIRVHFFKGEDQLYAFDTVIKKRVSDTQLNLRYAFKLPMRKKSSESSAGNIYVSLK